MSFARKRFLSGTIDDNEKNFESPIKRETFMSNFLDNSTDNELKK